MGDTEFFARSGQKCSSHGVKVPHQIKNSKKIPREEKSTAEEEKKKQKSTIYRKKNFLMVAS